MNWSTPARTSVAAERTQAWPPSQALRDGDERAFTELLERYHAALVRLATTYVSDRAVAEEIVQETWLAVLRGIDRSQARATLKRR